MWYFYVVRCCDNSLYAGITTDVDRRVSQHNTSKRGAKYTRSRRPVALVHVEEFTSKSSALKKEAQFKKLPKRKKEETILGKKKEVEVIWKGKLPTQP